MKMNITLYTIENYTDEIFAKYSKKHRCSRCHESYLTLLDNGLYTCTSENKLTIYLLGYCSNCDQISFIEFKNISKPFPFFLDEPQLRTLVDLNPYSPICFPNTIPLCGFEETLSFLSPRFIQIYRQSIYAEQFGLSELYIFGYRKALEFLIKDFLIFENLQEEKNVIDMDLIEAINALKFDEANPPATIVRKLGNNGTHYEERIEPFSNEDPKEYLNAVATFINAKYVSIKAAQYFSTNLSAHGEDKTKLAPNASPEAIADRQDEIEGKE